MGGKQSTHLLKIPRLSAELAATPPSDSGVTQTTQQPPPTHPRGPRIIDARVGKPPAFSSDENVETGAARCAPLRQWWISTRQNDARSRAGGAREHAATQGTSEPRHGRSAQVSVCHVGQWTHAADHPTTAEWCARLQRPCSKVQPALASPTPGAASRAHAFRIWSGASWYHRLFDRV